MACPPRLAVPPGSPSAPNRHHHHSHPVRLGSIHLLAPCGRLPAWGRAARWPIALSVTPPSSSPPHTPPSSPPRQHHNRNTPHDARSPKNSTEKSQPSANTKARGNPNCKNQFTNAVQWAVDPNENIIQRHAAAEKETSPQGPEGTRESSSTAGPMPPSSTVHGHG